MRWSKYNHSVANKLNNNSWWDRVEGVIMKVRAKKMSSDVIKIDYVSTNLLFLFFCSLGFYPNEQK